jgi:hypothetical protein
MAVDALIHAACVAAMLLAGARQNAQTDRTYIIVRFVRSV